MGKESTDSAPRCKMTNDGERCMQGMSAFHMGDDQEVIRCGMRGSEKDSSHVVKCLNRCRCRKNC